MAYEISTGPAAESAALPNAARTPHRFVVARRALVIAAVAIVVDLASITLAYTIANAARLDKAPDLRLLLNTEPRLITIPFWLAVFFAFGMYSRKQVLEPALSVTRVLSAISVSTLLTMVVAVPVGRLDSAGAWRARACPAAIPEAARAALDRSSHARYRRQRRGQDPGPG